VRELRNVIRRSVVFASEVIEPANFSFLSADAFPPTAVGCQPALVGRSLRVIADAAAADAEQQAIRQALRATNGNRGKAARELQIDYKTLYLKMKQYRIPAAHFAKSSPIVR